MSGGDFVSQKEYSKHVGCDVVIIDRAIKAGKIPADCITVNPVNKYKLIDVIRADQAWGKEYMQTRRRPNKRQAAKDQPQQHVKEIIKQVPADQPASVGDMPELGAKTSYNEADRQKKIYEAQLLQLKLEEERGGLVRMETIKKAFYDSAHIVRDSFISLADRVIDQVYSAENRNTAHIILQTEINIVLESFAKIPEYRNE